MHHNHNHNLTVRRSVTALATVCLLTLLTVWSPDQAYAELFSQFWPQSMYHDTLYICRDSTQSIEACFAANPLTHEGVRFILEVPVGFAVMKPTHRRHRGGMFFPMSFSAQIVQRDGQSYTRYAMACRGAITHQELSAVGMNDLLLLLVQARADAPQRATFYYHLADDKQTETEHKLRVVVLPPLAGKQPKHIRIGMYSWILSNTELSEKEGEALANTWRQAGITEGDVNLPVNVCRGLGLKKVFNFWWQWTAPEYLKHHPDAAAIGFDGKPYRPGSGTVCPTVLLDRHSGALNEELASIKKWVGQEGVTGLVWDMEGPGAWDACFGPRCLAVFRHAYRIDAEQPLSPTIIKQKYASQWVAFCTRQSMQLARRFTEAVHQANPHARFSVYAGPCFPGMTKQVAGNRCLWPQIAPVIDAACYSWYDPNVLNDAGHAQWILRNVRGNRPTLPVGVALWAGPVRGEGKHWSTNILEHPNVLTIQILQAACHGLNDSIRIWYDEPCDGRFFTAIARASAIISDLENYLLHGRVVDNDLPALLNKQLPVVELQYMHKRAILIFNISKTQTQRVTARPDVPAGLQLTTYPDHQVVAGATINTTLKPLSVKVYFVESR